VRFFGLPEEELLLLRAQVPVHTWGPVVEVEVEAAAVHFLQPVRRAYSLQEAEAEEPTIEVVNDM
jgi:hypothetical protein